MAYNIIEVVRYIICNTKQKTYCHNVAWLQSGGNRGLSRKSNSSVDIERLEVFFKPVTSASQSSPAGWTSLNPGSAVSTHKVPLAALMDLGLFSELIKTNLEKY